MFPVAPKSVLDQSESVEEGMENRVEELSLPEQLKSALEEARILLPGIQALFGFQLIAIFSAGFASLDSLDQSFHWFAMILTLISMAMALAPTALHRQVMPHAVSEELVASASNFLTSCLVPLILGMALEMRVLSWAIFKSDFAAYGSGVFTFSVLMGMWFGYPQFYRHARNPKKDF